jgi:hypothetical protein
VQNKGANAMKISIHVRCLVVMVALVLLLPGCKKPQANTNTQNNTQGGNTTFSAPDPGGAVQNVRAAALRPGVENELRQLAVYYREYADTAMKPPASLMDLPDVKRDLPKLYKEITDGDFIVIWNLNPARVETSNTVLAYVAKASPQGRLVAFLDGHVLNMTEDQFAKATKGAK